MSNYKKKNSHSEKKFHRAMSIVALILVAMMLVPIIYMIVSF